jgi:Flp pilus assembly protein TadB
MQTAAETAAFLSRFSTQDRVRNARLFAAAERGGWLQGDSGLGYFSLSFVAFLGAAWLLNWEATPPNFVCIGVLAAVALTHAVRGWITARRATRRLAAVAEIITQTAGS